MTFEACPMVITKENDEENCIRINGTIPPMEALQDILLNTQRNHSLPARFRALFTLKNIGSEEAVTIIGKAFEGESSALLKHELAYVLGQMRLQSSLVILYKVLANVDEDPMVRHEAGEALGAIGLEESMPVLERFLSDPEPAVKETCEIAIDNIKNSRGVVCPCYWPGDIQYGSVDPAPPMDVKLSIDQLETILLDTGKPLWERYRAMFSLRNRSSTAAVLALAKGLNDKSALFRHEVAYVLGQLQHNAAIDALEAVLCRPEEAAMVRHECAEALGSIAEPRCDEILRRFVNDPVQVVKESCMVALDICEFERNDSMAFISDK